MSHRPATRRTHRRRAAALLAAGALLVWTAASCSSGDEGASTTSTSRVTADSDQSTDQVATACRDVDLAPIESAAGRFVTAEAAVEAATTEAEVTTAVVGLLDAGSTLFSTMASSLDDLFDALADAAGQPSLADVPDGFRSAADDFSTLATDVDDAGTITDADIARIDEISARFDDLGATVESDSEGGQQLRRVPACETFIREFEAIFTSLEGGAPGTTGDTGSNDGVNTDVANGVCDQSRWLADPDCGDDSVMNSDLADGSCDTNRFFTDPDC